MNDEPENDPLGARPVLPAPHGVPAKRAREMFSAYLAQTRALKSQPATASETEPTVGQSSAPSSTSRDYSHALSILLAGAPTPALEERVEDTAEESKPLARPPVGAASVRPPVASRPAPTAIDQSILESLADNALLHHGPDGTSAFEIAFSDEVFPDLGCTVRFGEDGVVATFRAVDTNTRRLLEAEAGQLRVRLEDRGLKVKEVRVEES